MESGFIYRITNNTSGKKYIGQAREFKSKHGVPYRYGVNGRWSDHVSSAYTSSTPLSQDIMKFGKDNFIVEDVAKAALDELDALEATWIQKENSLTPIGYNVMRHSQNKHRSKSNIASFFRGKVVRTQLRKIRKDGEYHLVYAVLELNDDTKQRLTFGQHSQKKFEDAWQDAIEFAELVEAPYSEDLSNSPDPLEKYSNKLAEFDTKHITKIRIAPANSLVAVYVTTSEMKSWKDQIRVCFGGKTITQEEAYGIACLFVDSLKKEAVTILIDTIQSLQQVAAFMDKTAP